MNKIDQILLDGLLHPEDYLVSSFYPSPINFLILEELEAFGVKDINEVIDRLYVAPAPNGMGSYYFFDTVCIVETRIGKFYKPHREKMYNKIDVKQKENIDWVRFKNIDEYAYRQATSCDYLEQAFSFLDQFMDEKQKNLCVSLLFCHGRQKSQIENVLGDIPKETSRKSFYFESVWDSLNFNPEEPDLFTFWCIQAVSYLRGRHRYSLLQTYNSSHNSRYLVNEYIDERDFEWNSNMWSQFHSDASINANLVFNYLYSNFEQLVVDEMVNKVIENESKIVKEIIEYDKNR